MNEHPRALFPDPPETARGQVRVAVLLGSLREESVNRRLAQQLVADAPEGVTMQIIDDLDTLPFFNEDQDRTSAPSAVSALRTAIAAVDRILIVSPEYNASMPAVIKNAIDWLSRPPGAGAIVDKPLGVIGTTPTRHGGKLAHDAIAASARTAGAIVVPDAQVSRSYRGIDVLRDPDVHREMRSALLALVGLEFVA